MHCRPELLFDLFLFAVLVFMFYQVSVNLSNYCENVRLQCAALLGCDHWTRAEAAFLSTASDEAISRRSWMLRLDCGEQTQMRTH